MIGLCHRAVPRVVAPSRAHCFYAEPEDKTTICLHFGCRSVSDIVR